MRQVTCGLGHRHFIDEECPQCLTPSNPVTVGKTPDKYAENAIKETEVCESPTGAYDPLVQEARDYWTPRIGREAAIELSPECDPLPGERTY